MFPRTWAVWCGVAVQAVIGCGDRGEAATECDDVLISRVEFPNCDGRECAQVVEQRDRLVSWQLVLQRYYDKPDGQEYELNAEQFARHTECVVQQLERLRVSVEVLENEDLRVEASYAQIESALHTTAIDSVELECVESDCEKCTSFDEQQCVTDALCGVIGGHRLDAERMCRDSGFAGCGRARRWCDEAITTGLDPDGACWKFGNSCLPIGFVPTLSTDERCGYAQFDEVEACGSQ